MFAGARGASRRDSDAELDDETCDTPTFEADVSGDYLLLLFVSDGTVTAQALTSARIE